MCLGIIPILLHIDLESKFLTAHFLPLFASGYFYRKTLLHLVDYGRLASIQYILVHAALLVIIEQLKCFSPYDIPI